MKERRTETLKKKTWIVLMLFSFIVFLIFIDYGYKSLLFNGLILLFSSFFLTELLVIDKFYIDHGVIEHEEKEVFKQFCKKHPLITLYNKLITIAFFVALATSVTMIISWFFVK